MKRFSKTRLSVTILLLVVAVFALAYAVSPAVRQALKDGVAVLSSNPAQAAAYVRSFGAIGPLVSASLMILQSLAAPLPAFLITFANGMIWGAFWGGLLSWTAAMIGAALCFWIARALGRPAVEKLVGGSKALETSDFFFERYGQRAVIIARLLPFVSFDIISYGAGLTNMSFRSFIIATGIGQIPATALYSYLASVGGATHSVTVLLIVFGVTTTLLIIGISMRPWLMKRFISKTPEEE